MPRMKSLRSWLTVSLIVAGFSFVSGMIGLGGMGRLHRDLSAFVELSFFSASAWFFIVAVSPLYFGLRAMWLLLGVPLALFWFCVVLVLTWGHAKLRRSQS